MGFRMVWKLFDHSWLLEVEGQGRTLKNVDFKFLTTTSNGNNDDDDDDNDEDDGDGDDDTDLGYLIRVFLMWWNLKHLKLTIDQLGLHVLYVSMLSLTN